jgi:hypothetical protein
MPTQNLIRGKRPFFGTFRLQRSGIQWPTGDRSEEGRMGTLPVVVTGASAEVERAVSSNWRACSAPVVHAADLHPGVTVDQLPADRFDEAPELRV